VNGTGTYNAGTTVLVTASASVGSSFSGWSGPNATECATNTVIMTGNKSCTANFTLNTYTMSLNTAGTGSGTVSGGGTYNYNQSATVTATANSDSNFAGWTGANAAECTTGTVVITANKTCTATFNLNNSPADLLVSGFTVSPSPAAVGQQVTVTATITNSGATSANNFEVDLYQNRSTKPSVGQLGDASCAVASLAPVDSTTCMATFTYNASGTVTVWALADTLNSVSESSEANNTAHANLSVR
jgi:hypothetical protein